jgi:hypothetical protein
MQRTELNPGDEIVPATTLAVTVLDGSTDGVSGIEWGLLYKRARGVFACLTTEIAGLPEWGDLDIPDGVIDVPYGFLFSMPFAATPVTYSVVDGALPDGLTLDPGPDSGSITGTPTVADTFNFTLRAENEIGFDEVDIEIIIHAPAGGSGKIVRPFIGA